MNDALAGASWPRITMAPRYAISRIFHEIANIFLHPIITLPVLVYLLGGTSGEMVWYAIVAGIAAGLAAPAGMLVTLLPGISRIMIAALLALQTLGFLVTGFVALSVDTLSGGTVLTTGAISYLLLIVPAAILARISEQGHEFRKSSSASLTGVMPAIFGAIIAGLTIWRLFTAEAVGPAGLIARVLLAGALTAGAAAWLASYPTLLALHFPHPARPMPTIRSPRLLRNGPLRRYALFQLIRGLARFADPFILVGALVLLAPGMAWIGGAVFAFCIGMAIARIVATSAYDNLNVRVLFIISGFLHVIALMIVAFGNDVLASSIIADHAPSGRWQDRALILAALALGMSYLFARTGHRAYIRAISSPQTRELSLTVVGVIMMITAFAPIIAVRVLDAQAINTLLQIATGASVISLLATGLIVAPYSTPKPHRNAWGLRG